MMKLLFIIALCLAGFTSVSAQTSKAEKEVRAVVKQWADSIVNRDMNALGAILSDDLIVTAFDGATRGKREELEILKPNPNVKTVSVENENLRVKIYGKTAVVTAVTKMVFVVSEKTATNAFRYTAVFVKQKGRWQIVALQTARIASPKTN